jgi:sterol 3beta-glucosyltransferase
MQSLGVAPAPIPIRRLNAERLVVALDQTLNDAQIGDRAAELARRVRRDHGVEVACGVIESRLISRAHVRDLKHRDMRVKK